MNPPLLHIDPPADLPPHLWRQWLTVKHVAKRNYPRAMKLARLWGAALAEWDMAQAQLKAA